MKATLSVKRREEFEVIYDGIDWKLYEDKKGVLRLVDMMSGGHVLIDGDDLDELDTIYQIIQQKLDY